MNFISPNLTGICPMKKFIPSLIVIVFCLFPYLTFGGGECIEGACINGKGTYKFSDNSIYEGE